MNSFQFIRLINSIYGKGMPDIEWIQKLGLLAIKIAQVHALRIDFLEREKCEELAKLYRANVFLPAENIKQIITDRQGAEFLGNFEFFNETPVASASVGQVHRATLADGKDVAVKVVKKNFKDNFIRDVNSVSKLFKFITLLYPRIKQVGDPIGILNDIREYTLNELNLRNELEGHNILEKIYEENKNKFDLSNLRFAKIYEKLSSENILVSEFIEGKTFDELLETSSLGYPELLRLFHIHGFYLFIIGTFHGDIHPGNIIFHDNKIYFIDTGYIGYVGTKIRKGLFSFFEGLSSYDYEKCAYSLNKMSEPEISGSAYKEFQKTFIQLYGDFTNKTVSEISLTKKMMQTIKLGVKSGMVFEKGIFAIIRSLMYLDGMVLRCNPDAVLMKDMKQYIEEFKKVI